MRPTKPPPDARPPLASATAPAAGPVPPTIVASSPPAPPLGDDHHLWRNGRLWWIAITLYDAQGNRRRVRQSLGTTDLAEARRQRDQFLARVRRERRFTFASRDLRADVAPETGEHAPRPRPSAAGVAA